MLPFTEVRTVADLLNEHLGKKKDAVFGVSCAFGPQAISNKDTMACVPARKPFATNDPSHEKEWFDVLHLGYLACVCGL